MKTNLFATCLPLALMLVPLQAAAQQSALFSDPLDGTGPAGAWRRPPAAAWFVDAPGGRAMRYERGATWDAATQPWVGDETWDNYRIEVEILPGEMWAGVDFHVADDGGSACNLTLIRGEDDRLTFEISGIWGAACSWKLYPMGQRRPPHARGEWVRLRVDVGSSAANVFVGDEPEPYATFHDLPCSRGGVRLMTYYSSAHFRNFRVAALPADVAPALEDPWAFAHAADAGVLRSWEVTAPHGATWGAGAIPAEVANATEPWRPAPVDARGVVDLSRLFSPQNESGAAFARTTFESDAAGTRTLKLTYTDDFTLWCNGARVFTGPSRQWFHPDRAKHGHSRLIPDQYEVAIPVRPGTNELLVRTSITERFGWAFWGRLLPPTTAP